MLIIWALFAPTQVGGLASYVMIVGSSMEPDFHIGDLVIARQESTYRIGDAVVYRNLDLQSFVFHRIIAEKMGRFTLQGDNNSWADTYQPSTEEIVGKLWLHIPRGGSAIQKIRSPWIMGLTAAALGGLLATSFFTNKPKGNKSMNKKSIQEWFGKVRHNVRKWLTDLNTTGSHNPALFEQRGMLEGIFFSLGLLFLLSLFLGIIVFSRPTSRMAQANIQFQHVGIFSYSASAPQGVYDLNAIKSGDPIFPRLTCSVDVTFQYTLIAPQAEDIAGTYQLTAIIYEPVSGWQRNIPLQEETAFTGTIFGTVAKLDTCKIAALTQSMEEGTDFHPGSYKLLITPNIQIKGEIAGHQLDSRFSSGLTFLYNRTHFYLLKEEDVEDPLSVTGSETLQKNETEANTLKLFGSEIKILTLRWMTLFGLAASLGGFIFLGLKLQDMYSKDQDGFFRVKYDALIVDIHSCDTLALSNCVDVKSMDALARLAERFNAMILHLVNGSQHTYYVQGTGITYRLEINATPTESTITADEAGNPGSAA